MSAKKKKLTAQKNRKKKLSIKKLIAAVIAGLLVAVFIVFVVFKANEQAAKEVLKNTDWIPYSAKNASGDQVDLNEVYQTKYSNYQGNLHFDDSHHFELWLSPGIAGDGTHTGTYELFENKINVKFDDGTENDFKVNKTDNHITTIEVKYNDYTVTFNPS